MKCNVISPYTDRHTDEVHMPGDEVELTAARATELEEGGFVEKPKPKAKAQRARK